MVFKKETEIEEVKYGEYYEDIEYGDGDENLEKVAKFMEIVKKLKNFGSSIWTDYTDRRTKVEFFNSEFVVENFAVKDIEGNIRYNGSEITLWRPTEKKVIALDFMGTMNQADSKEMIWEDVKEQIISGNTGLLKKSGITDEQLKEFKEYCKDHSGMELRQYMLANKDVKQAFGRYTSIAAEEKGFDYCQATQDSIDFLTIANILGHTVEIFSTVGAPEGYKNLQQIVLEKQKLPEEYSRITGKNNVFELVDGGIIVSKLKKSEPGKAVIEETKNKGLSLYVDDETNVISSVIDSFAQPEQTEREILPILCQIDRTDKQLAYEEKKHPGIINFQSVKSLTDQTLLSHLYRK